MSAPEPAADLATTGTARRFTQPEPGDSLATIAARELPDLPEQEAVDQLTSWNLHLALRPLPGLERGAVLCSDIVYLEPPRPS